jgi:hypothetical protein
LPPPNDAPNAAVWAAPPNPLKQGTVGRMGGVIAELTGILGAAMFVTESFELFPFPVAMALPPAAVEDDRAFPPFATCDWACFCCCFWFAEAELLEFELLALLLLELLALELLLELLLEFVLVAEGGCVVATGSVSQMKVSPESTTT